MVRRRGCELDLVDIIPEGSEVEVVIATDGDQIWIYSIIWFRRRRCDASSPQIRPGARL